MMEMIGDELASVQGGAAKSKAKAKAKAKDPWASWEQLNRSYWDQSARFWTNAMSAPFTFAPPFARPWSPLGY
jgi:hypothetical protein